MCEKVLKNNNNKNKRVFCWKLNNTVFKKKIEKKKKQLTKKTQLPSHVINIVV